MTTSSNPVPRSSLFCTPESLEDLDIRIKQLPRQEQVIAYQYTMMAFNLAHKLTEKEFARLEKSLERAYDSIRG
jgi:hypothetical protein